VSATASASAVAMAGARWEQAYRASFPRVYRALIALGARADEAEDALQDAFVKGLSTTSVESVEGWLFVVSMRAWRRRRMRDRLLVPFSALARERTAETDPVARIALFAALRRLPERQAQVLVARYLVGLSQEETARALGITRGTVGATTTQAAGALRRALMTEGDR